MPALPEQDAAGDLLGVDEVAALYGRDPLTVQLCVRDGYLPGRDATPYGVWHWRRGTLEQRSSPGQGARIDRAQELVGTGQQRVYQALEHDPKLTLTELTRIARVSRPAASKWRR